MPGTKAHPEGAAAGTQRWRSTGGKRPTRGPRYSPHALRLCWSGRPLSTAFNRFGDTQNGRVRGRGNAGSMLSCATPTEYLTKVVEGPSVVEMCGDDGVDEDNTSGEGSSDAHESIPGWWFLAEHAENTPLVHPEVVEALAEQQ